MKEKNELTLEDFITEDQFDLDIYLDYLLKQSRYQPPIESVG
ncbi:MULTISPECIES: hypothetical protein [Bacillaceae]|nr:MULTISPECIES: hypothetical protein [Bacillaceae]MDT2047821.1 hypothetical protein [Priestia flexa]